MSIGKLELDKSYSEVAVDLPASHNLEILPITTAHLEIVSRLAVHHRDPFDRLLVAQCLADNMTIISSDAALDAYGIERRW